MRTVVLILDLNSRSTPVGLLGQPTPRVFDWVDLGWSLRVCICKSSQVVLMLPV